MATRVKVCGMTSVADARACTRLGADYLGVIFYPKSPRCVKNEALADLILAIPDGKRVMVDVAPDTAEIARRLDLGFDYFQIHFDPASTSRDRIESWSKLVGRRRLWLAPRLGPGTPFPAELADFAQTFVIDGYKTGEYGGTGMTGDWENFARLKEAQPELNLILAGGLRPDNILAALEASHAGTVDLNSGVESSPGVKDLEKVAASIKTIRRHG